MTYYSHLDFNNSTSLCHPSELYF